jgi:hypothetical protein
MIMDGVFASYISRLSDEYTKIETPSAKVKETMLSDATYITTKLSELPGVRKMDQGLIQVVEAREVTSPKQQPQQESPSPKQLENGTRKSSKEESKDEVLFDASALETEQEKETSTKEG